MHEGRYAKAKICVNCFTTNWIEDARCRCCGHLFMEEISTKEFNEIRDKLQKKGEFYDHC